MWRSDPLSSSFATVTLSRAGGRKLGIIYGSARRLVGLYNSGASQRGIYGGGVPITAVTPGSQAAASGVISVKDLLYTINGADCSTFSATQVTAKLEKAGDSVELGIRHWEPRPVHLLSFPPTLHDEIACRHA